MPESASVPKRRPRRRRTIALALAATAIALTGCAASADGEASGGATPTAAATVSATVLAQGERDAGIDVDVTGPVEVTQREIVIPPGTGTGLHCHDGSLVGVVEQGTLTHYAPVYPTGVHEYAAGDAIVEGAGYQHEGRNKGDEDVILLVTYLIPQGDPLAETDLSRCDPLATPLPTP